MVGGGGLIIISGDGDGDRGVQIALLRPGNINLRGHFIGIYWNGKNQVMWSKSHQRLQGDLAGGLPLCYWLLLRGLARFKVNRCIQ